MIPHIGPFHLRPLQVGSPASPGSHSYQQPNQSAHRQLPQPQVTQQGQGQSHRGLSATSGSGGQRQMSAPPEVMLGTSNQNQAALTPRSPISRRSHIPYT